MTNDTRRDRRNRSPPWDVNGTTSFVLETPAAIRRRRVRRTVPSAAATTLYESSPRRTSINSRRLGNTELNVSELCFGTWGFGRETNGIVETGRKEANELLDTAADHGIDFIDAANVYETSHGESEEHVGEWLAEREDYVIASMVDSTSSGRTGRRYRLYGSVLARIFEYGGVACPCGTDYRGGRDALLSRLDRF